MRQPIDANTTEIAQEDLARTWVTLTAVMGNYEWLSLGAASLIEARRLIEVEMREQHGDDAWADMTGGDL